MTLSSVIAMLLAGQPAERVPDLFDALEGEWVCRLDARASGPVFRRERWRGYEDGRVAGEIRSVAPARDGSEQPAEARLFFSRRGRVPRLTYETAAGRPVFYRLARGTRDEAVFETVRNGSPRIISYRLNQAGRLEVMHGLENGGSRRWHYQRPGPHQVIGSCDGSR